MSGCSGSADSGLAVSAKELQKSLVDRLAQAGTPSSWVNCPKDLPGRVGSMTRCEVKFSSDKTVTALLTTTEVLGDQVAWEITGPLLTDEQVTQWVAGVTSAQAANCDSGLDGRPGDWVECHTISNGVTLDQTVEIRDATGLSLDLALTPAMPKQQVEDLLRTKLADKYRLAFESATCPGDLVGVVGTTMSCVAVSGGTEETYTLIVGNAGNGMMTFDIGGLPTPAEAPTGLPPVQVAAQPALVEAAPRPAPVEATSVYRPAPSRAAAEPAPSEGVPHLPPVVPHLPPGQPVPAPGPLATQAGAVEVFTQAAGG